MAEISSSDPILRKNYNDLCLSIGHMFVCWGRLEGTLASVLKLHLGQNFGDHYTLEDGIGMAGAIYGSMRFKVARDNIKRILVVEGAPSETVTFLTDLFAHIGHIEGLRDKVAHQFILPVNRGIGGKWLLTDVTTTKDVKNSLIYHVSTDAISLAADDLNLAAHRLGYRPSSMKLYQCGGLDTSPVPWLYKQEMLELAPRKKAPAAPAQQPPPAA